MSEIAKDLLPLAVSLTKLKPAEHNPRKGDVDSIAKSYERFGQRKPIVARKGSGEIIAGNHQYMAAVKLGWSEIAVVWVEDDEKTATAYSVADNRIGQLGEWDLEELVFAFDEIEPADLDSIGFSQVEVEDMRALLDETEMSVLPATRDLERTTGAGQIDTELQVKKDNSYDEFLERYANRAVRAIILYYPNEEYAKMVDGLDKLAKQIGTSDNAETVQALIKEKLGE